LEAQKHLQSLKNGAKSDTGRIEGRNRPLWTKWGIQRRKVVTQFELHAMFTNHSWKYSPGAEHQTSQLQTTTFYRKHNQSLCF